MRVDDLALLCALSNDKHSKKRGSHTGYGSCETARYRGWIVRKPIEEYIYYKIQVLYIEYIKYITYVTYITYITYIIR